MARHLPYPLTWHAPPAGKVLVLGAHPDDEVLSCGGILALHARQGDDVHVVIASDGAAGDPAGRYAAAGRDGYVELRRAESRAAAAILGIPPPEFWDFPDQGLARADGLVEKLAATLDALRPTIVYRPSAIEMHPDHAALAAAFDAAARRVALRSEDYAYDSWVQVHPTHVIDVTEVWPWKRRAAEEFVSQLAYVDYVRAVEGLAAARSVFLPNARFVEAYARTERG